MKRIFSHTVAALAAGLCLRLYFLVKFPAANGSDTILYEQIATNWLQHHIYAMNVNGTVTPVDLRMPGYPAFLALLYAITGRVGEAARSCVMLAQAFVDLGACLLTALLATSLATLRPGLGRPRRAFVITWWLAALCPFTANYVAAPLTEVFAGFFTAGALLALVVTFWPCALRGLPSANSWAADRAASILPLAAGLCIGMGTLFRPETPLLLLVAWLGAGWIRLGRRERFSWWRVVVLSGIGCALPLAPWAVRNAVTLHEVQFLAPKNSNLPGELVPYGFMAWEKTWLFRVKDCYLVPWKLNGEVINLEDIPARAFDTPAEKERVAALLERYNNDVTLSVEEDAAFAELARERTARHPLRRHLWLPIARAFTIWFTPRIELLPFSGRAFPVKEAWREDPIDFSFTVGFFLLNLSYVVVALWGAWRLWREGPAVRRAVALLIGYLLVRTAFLTTLETPEPRYVLVCFPAILALAGQVFAPSDPVEIGLGDQLRGDEAISPLPAPGES